MDLRSLQKPLKEQYRNDPNSSRITLRAKGGQTNAPVACSVDIGRAIYQAEAHKGVGGAGAGACSGDLLLGALAACAQITCQMVAAAMDIATERIEVTVEGDLDLQGTLGISKDVPVGFESIRLNFDVVAPHATPEQMSALREKTEQYCVVMQTLLRPPSLRTRSGLVTIERTPDAASFSRETEKTARRPSMYTLALEGNPQLEETQVILDFELPALQIPADRARQSTLGTMMYHFWANPCTWTACFPRFFLGPQLAGSTIAARLLWPSPRTRLPPPGGESTRMSLPAENRETYEISRHRRQPQYAG